MENEVSDAGNSVIEMISAAVYSDSGDLSCSSLYGMVDDALESHNPGLLLLLFAHECVGLMEVIASKEDTTLEEVLRRIAMAKAALS